MHIYVHNMHIYTQDAYICIYIYIQYLYIYIYIFIYTQHVMYILCSILSVMTIPVGIALAKQQRIDRRSLNSALPLVSTREARRLGDANQKVRIKKRYYDIFGI